MACGLIGIAMAFQFLFYIIKLNSRISANNFIVFSHSASINKNINHIYIYIYTVVVCSMEGEMGKGEKISFVVLSASFFLRKYNYFYYFIFGLSRLLLISAQHAV